MNKIESLFMTFKELILKWQKYYKVDDTQLISIFMNEERNMKNSDNVCSRKGRAGCYKDQLRTLSRGCGQNKKLIWIH